MNVTDSATHSSSGSASTSRVERTALEIIRGNRNGPGPSLARGVLWAASGLFRAGVGFRNGLYDSGLRKQEPVDAKVISVGNLTAGGTGKTPMVEWLGRWIMERGYQVAVLSRGYGPGPQGERPVPEGMNDEGLLLQANLGKVHLVLGSDRLRGAQAALSQLEPSPECFLLDDGFQHRRLARDLDALLIDALNPFGYGHLLPRGLLREPVKNLRRADLIVLTRADQVGEDEAAHLRERVIEVAPDTPVLSAVHEEKGFLQCTDFSPIGAGWMKGKRVYAFCALGNPEGFRRSLEKMDVEIVGFREYADHHWYSTEDIQELSALAESAKADVLVATQKDAVKFGPEVDLGLPFLCLRIGIRFLDGEPKLTERLTELFPEERSPRQAEPETQAGSVSVGKRPEEPGQPWDALAP